MKLFILLTGLLLAATSYAQTSHFKTGSAKITPTLEKELNKFYTENIKNKKDVLIEVKVTGHTDVRGSEKYNLKLSKLRALSVKERLVRMGIEPKRIKVVGLGESKPIAHGHTLEDHAKNRRIELLVRYTNGKKLVVISEYEDCKKVVSHKNRVSLIAGYGALGNLKEGRTATGAYYETEQGAVLGIQLMRDFSTDEDSSVHGLIQVQTNKTLSIGIGLGF